MMKNNYAKSKCNCTFCRSKIKSRLPFSFQFWARSDLKNKEDVMLERKFSIRVKLSVTEQMIKECWQTKQ